jgi:tRNA (guanine26-N2/guanine27-N2)-dimethyltransferase
MEAQHEYEKIVEGKAEILFPKDDQVFYNPVQQFNRDMSIAAIKAWSRIFLKEKKERFEKRNQRKQKGKVD